MPRRSVSPGAAPLLILGLLAAPLAAQGPSRQLEAGAFYHRVSNGFGDWTGATARLTLQGTGNVWYVDARAQRAFRDEGVYGALTHVRDLSDGVYFSAGLGAGTGAFALPAFRGDASLHWKLGRARRVVLTTGGTYVRARQSFEDVAAAASLTWYASGAVLELGGRVNWSYPGAVRTERVMAGATLGRPGGRTVVLRGSAGREGYQLTGATQTLRRFSSQEGEALWREPIGRGWSVLLGGTWYHNPFYDRAGGSLGFGYAW